MTHTLIIRRSNGLVADELGDIYKPEVEMKQVGLDIMPCYVFKFRSGNYLYYPRSEYRYEYRSGYAM
jgi:hypothetical protein